MGRRGYVVLTVQLCMLLFVLGVPSAGAQTPACVPSAGPVPPTYCIYDDGTLCHYTGVPGEWWDCSNHVYEATQACANLAAVTGLSCQQVFNQLGITEHLGRAAILFDVHQLIEETVTDPNDAGTSVSVAVEPTGGAAAYPDQPPFGRATSADVDGWDALGATHATPSGVSGPYFTNVRVEHDQNCYKKGRGGIVDGKGDLFGTGFYLRPIPGWAPADSRYKYRAWVHQEEAKGAPVRYWFDYEVVGLWHGVSPRTNDTNEPLANSVRSWSPSGYQDISSAFSFDLGVSVPPISLGGSWSPTVGRAGGQVGDVQGVPHSSHAAGWGNSEGSNNPVGVAGHTIFRIPKGQGVSWQWGCWAAFAWFN